MRPLISLALIGMALALPAGAETAAPSDAQTAIRAAVANPQRTPANTARDIYRHPVETLTFFGVTPTQTVVEIWPAPGWYTEILAPLLRDGGKYVTAAQPQGQDREAIIALLASDPKRFDKAVLTTMERGKASDITPPGSADVVLTFRNVHNFLKSDTASAQLFADIYRALKPGGILGVVDHRLPEDADAALEVSSG